MTRPIGISVPHRRVEEDDDIQDYKKPWVGLTAEEIQDAISESNLVDDYPQKFVAIIEKKLKDKNHA